VIIAGLNGTDTGYASAVSGIRLRWPTAVPIEMHLQSIHLDGPHFCAVLSYTSRLLAGFDVAPSGAGLDDWSDTACGAAVDASKSELWPQSGSGVQAWRLKYKRDPYGVARTQRRHIAGINLLFAVSTSNLNEQAAVVAAIGVDLSAIVQAAGRVRDGPSLVAEGSKGADILRSLGRPSRRLLPGITRLGISREYWGPQADKNNQR